VVPPAVALVLVAATVVAMVVVALVFAALETAVVVCDVLVAPALASSLLCSSEQPVRIKHANGKRMNLMDFFISEPPRILPLCYINRLEILFIGTGSKYLKRRLFIVSF
jgi:hypothetical protein